MRVFLLLLMLAVPVSAEQPESLETAIPKTVFKLFEWPDTARLNASNLANTKSPKIAMAREDSWNWLKAVIAPAILPKEQNLIFLRNEFDQTDTVRTEWKTDKYLCQVSQTNSVMTIKVRPLDNSVVWGNLLSEFKDNALATAKYIFPDKGAFYRLDIKGPKWDQVPQLDKVISSCSFNPDNIQVLSVDNTMFGRPTPHAVELPGETISCWFRNIYWWSNGESIGFFFIKGFFREFSGWGLI